MLLLNWQNPMKVVMMLHYLLPQSCLDCAKLIYPSGITPVYFKDNYSSNDGIEFLRKSNVEVTKI